MRKSGPDPNTGGTIGRGHVKIFRLISVVGLSWEEILMVKVLEIGLEQVYLLMYWRRDSRGAYYNDGESGSNPSNTR